MNFLNFFSISISFVISFTGDLHAQFAPQPPVSPQTNQDCETFLHQYYSYLTALQNSYYRCSSASTSDVIKDWVNVDLCSGPSLKVPPECASLRRDWNCETDKMVSLYHECLARVPKNDRDDELNLYKAAGGAFPKEEGQNAMKMANYLLQQGNPSDAKNIAQLAGGLWMRKMQLNKVLKLLGPDSTLADRLAYAAGKVSVGPAGPISQQMLKIALQGVLKTNQEALDDLTRELDQFSQDIADQRATAVREAERQRMAEAATPRTVPAPSPAPPPAQTYRPPVQTYMPPAEAIQRTGCTHPWYQSCMRGDELCCPPGTPCGTTLAGLKSCCNRNLLGEFGLSCP